MARKSKQNIPAIADLDVANVPAPTETRSDPVLDASAAEEDALDELEESVTGEESQEPVLEDAGTTEEPSEEDQAPTEDNVIDFTQAKADFRATGLLERNRAEIAQGFDERAAYETRKNPNNETIHKSLGKSRAKLITEEAVAALAVCGVSPGFMTYSSHEGSAYNVYAIDKLCDLVGALNTGVMRNAVNLAIAKSLMNLKELGLTMSGEFSKACVSKNIRVQGDGAKVLFRHTASPATAPTQASSTMQALQTLGIVENKGSQKYPVYELTDTPASVRMQEVLSA